MPNTRTTKQQYWLSHIQQADAFDGSLAGYARTQGLSARDLYRWRNCLKPLTEDKQQANSTVFTQVITPTIQSASLTIDAGRLQLRFNRLPDSQWLGQLLGIGHKL